ncbi:15-hydroxyprostaglandin dehydrogenase [NAD(+)] [Aplysia californica]|uniref:15-hydroxyprostaglandin dehydrogenase [NAD(+)] n=1 Tax=Aplysia californica TaxID=6500 RepID=A0ABM0JXP4_APLCA|nr:15-hydroxyprostaglandin dehydrogenase [NAD(+)] [Aplysia californica]
MSVSGKVALITGAAQGLGRAFSEELLKKGAKVGLTDMNEEAGQATVSEFSTKYGQNKVFFMKCDVTSEAQMEETFQTIKERLGGLDIVINNAGIGSEFNGWEKTVDVNVKGVLRGSMLAMEHMRRDKGGNGGVIINVSSMGGINPNPCGPVYSATKAAVLMYSLSWALNPELTMNGLRINALAPSFVDTQLYQGLSDQSTIHVPQIAEKIIERVGIMTPQSVAENMMELIEDQTKNGAVMKLSKVGGKEYHKLT